MEQHGTGDTKAGAGRWPLPIAASLLLLVVAGFAWLSMKHNDGHLIYALDDTYIHMALAKNLSQHSLWGVTPFEFSSCSSSLLWALLLSGVYRLLGPVEWAPLVLALGSGLLLLSFADRIFRFFALPPWPRLGALGLCVFAIPLPALVFSGMEHLLHGALTLAFAYLVTREVSADDHGARGSRGWLLLVAPLVVMARMEGMYVVGVAALVLLLRRRLLLAPAVALAGALPVAVYALISTHLGALWAPSSVLVKSAAAQSLSLRHLAHLLIYTSWEHAQEAPHLAILAVMALLLAYVHLRGRGGLWAPAVPLTGLFVGATYLHLASAGIGTLFRYEAYLVALGLVTVAGLSWQAVVRSGGLAAQPRDLATNLALVVFLLAAGTPLLHRVQSGLRLIVISTTNIYQQQYQMARFVREYYPGSRVILNDIGAVNYYTDIHCLDVGGLASIEVTRARLEGRYDLRFVTDWAQSRRADIAIVYDNWFARDFGGVPTNWRRAGQWRIANNRICGGDTVSFYAVQPDAYPGLVSHLRQFAPRLPQAVTQLGDYTRR